MRRITHIATIAAACCAVGLAGCGSGEDDREVVVGQGSELFPAESMRDRKSYADHLAVYRVVGERAVTDASDQERGEGAVGRVVELAVEKVLWSAKGAPELPATIEMKTLGWALHDGKRIPYVTDEGPQMTVGDRFLSPLVQVNFGSGDQWWPLTYGSQMPVANGTAVRAWTGVSRAVAGKTPAAIAEQLRVTQPDPVAARFQGLRPQKRIEAVQLEGSDVPAEGP